MNPSPANENKLLHGVITFCGVILIAVSFLALLGWMLGISNLTSFGKNIIPMAPSTAIFFILLGFVLSLYKRIPNNRKSYLLGTWISIISLITTFTLFLFASNRIYSKIENFGFFDNTNLSGIPVGHMSPLTAICFIVSSITFILLLSSHKYYQARIRLAFWLSMVIILVSFVLLLGYILGTPIMYGGNIIPPALPTSILFLILGIGLLSATGARIWTPGQLRERYTDPVTYILIIVFLLLTVGIVMTGYLFYHKYEEQYKEGVKHQLQSITDSKIRELVQWRKERLGDASIFYNNPNFSDALKRYELNKKDTTEKFKILTWIRKIYDANQYECMLLFDNKMKLILGYLEDSCSTNLNILDNVTDTLKDKKIIFQDFKKDSISGQEFLNMLIPILDTNYPGNVIGILSIRIDPREYLYPLINLWPVTSETAETLIVRREGNEVVFLNELRFQKNTALKLRMSISNIHLPSVMAVLGKEGIVNGIDYQNTPVLANIKAIPGSPWYLIAKIDMQEINEPLQERLLTTLFFMVVFLVSASVTIGYVWRQQRLKFVEKELESTEEIRTLNRIYAILSDINQSIVRIRDIKNLFENACKIAVEQGGFIMAWIGMLDDSTKRIKVLAKAGDYGEYFNKLKITIKDEVKFGPSATSILTGQHVIVNDIKYDESDIPNKEYALEIGCRSMSAFPLIVNNKTIGNFNIYAAEPYFFNDRELKLLDELAMDISFAVDYAWKEGERLQAEQALKEREKRLSSIYDTVADIIFHLEVEKDTQYRFVSVNNAFQITTGLDASLVIGKRVDEIIPEPSLSMVRGKYEEAIREKKIVRWEETSIYPAGELIGEVSIAPVFDVKGICTHLVGAVHDITARKRAEQEIRLLNAELELRIDQRTSQLEEANKELEAFSYSVSHDLRAPLRSIIGFTKILLEESEGTLNDESLKAINIIIKNSDRMNQLIDDLLEFSKMVRLNMNKIDIDTNEMVKIILDELIANEKDRKIEINNLSLLWIKADSNMIKQVWVNLISNAIKYSRGKEITKIEIGSFVKEGESCFYIKDNGAGFDMKYYDKLFNVFQRLHSSLEFEGTGVGLALVKRIINRHGGRVWAESKPDAGATFYFSLSNNNSDNSTED